MEYYNTFYHTYADDTQVITLTPHDYSPLVRLHVQISKWISQNFMDSDLNFESHVKAITKAAYYHLKNRVTLEGYLLKQNLFICFFFFIRLECCNGVFTGLNKKNNRPPAAHLKCCCLSCCQH